MEWINRQTSIDELPLRHSSLIQMCRVQIPIMVLHSILRDENIQEQHLLLDLAKYNEWAYVGEILELYKRHRLADLYNVTNCNPPTGDDEGISIVNQRYSILMYIADACKKLDNEKKSTDAIKFGLPIINELVYKYKANINQTRTILKIGIVNALQIYRIGNNYPQHQIIDILTPPATSGGKKNIIKRKKNKTIKKTKKLKKSIKPKRGKKSKKRKRTRRH